MFTLMIIVLILPVVFLPLALTFFSSTELEEMGVCLENRDGISYEQQTLQSEPILVNLAVACGNS